MTLTPLLDAPLEIQIHAFSAIAAFLLGAVILWREKGTKLHKLMGRTWAVLMLVTATSALFINEIRLIGPFSPIHIFVIMTYAGIAEGIWHIRKGNVARHRAAMQGLYMGALILAGTFTFLPGRRMYEVLFGTGEVTAFGVAGSAMVIVAALAAAGFTYLRLRRQAAA